MFSKTCNNVLSAKTFLTLQVSLLIAIQFGDCARVSFKESLTALSEKSDYPVERLTSPGSSNPIALNKNWDIGSQSSSRLVAKPALKLPSNVQLKKEDDGEKSIEFMLNPNNEADGSSKFSWILSDIAKPVEPRAQNETKSAPYPPAVNPSAIHSVAKPNGYMHDKKYSNGFQDWPRDQNQLRDKKEISNNPGLREIFWNTATALWSVNKEHFLPTFLHTKTGGKLSLGRNSLFEPVNILSQFKHGVKEINNEKRQSLARLSRAGWGWSGATHPKVLLVSVQRNHNVAWTIARYLLRLTRHTATTKYKLSRAVLRLQLRAIRKIIRILRSRTFAQTLATIKILTNAAWKGKRYILRCIINLGGPKTTPAPHYIGGDNSNVDITYNSLRGHDSYQSSWGTYKAPEYNVPPPQYKPQATAPQEPQTPYYAPPKSPNSFSNEPNLDFVPPAPLLQAATFTNFGHFAEPPQPSTQNSLLIDTPSYANLLQQMGIDPVNNEFKESSNKNLVKTVPEISSFTSSTSFATSLATNPSTNSHFTSSTSQMSPSPTVVYFTSQQPEKVPVAPQPASSNIDNVYFTTETPPTATFPTYLSSPSSLSTTITLPDPSTLQQLMSSSPIPLTTSKEDPTSSNMTITSSLPSATPTFATQPDSLATESSNTIEGESEHSMSLSKLLKALALRDKERRSTSVSYPGTMTTSYTVVSSPSMTTSTPPLVLSTNSPTPRSTSSLMTPLPSKAPDASEFRMKLLEAMFADPMTSREP